MKKYAKSCFASPGGFSQVFVVSIHKLIDIVPEPGVEHTVSTILDGVWNEFLHPHPSAIEDLCPCQFLLAIDFTRFGPLRFLVNHGPRCQSFVTESSLDRLLPAQTAIRVQNRILSTILQ